MAVVPPFFCNVLLWYLPFFILEEMGLLTS